MKKIIVMAGAASLLTLSFLSCSSGSSGSGSALTAAGKMTSGMGGAVDTIQGIGGAMGTNGTFSVGIPMGSVSTRATVSAANARSKCSAHGEPGDDANHDGVVDGGERYNPAHNNFALQSFYCVMASDANGPESVSGSVGLIKTVVCAVEKQIGTLAFDGASVPMTGITLDRTCATQAQIDDMTGTTGQSSVEMSVAGGLTVISTLNPTFSDIPSNTHYSHGIKLESNTPGLLKFIVLAKFNPASANPIESGDFEFATMGSGTMMQGTGIEFTAGKVYGTGVTKHLWYEMRVNRIKTGSHDPVCQPDDTSASSCGFTRHIRLSTDVAFSGGDISDVSNFTGILSDGGDSNESGQSDQMRVLTANGSLSTGLTGKIYQKTASPTVLNGASTVANSFAGMGETGPTTCIIGAGSGVSTTCGASASVLTSTGLISTYVKPAATSNAWISHASTKGGIGFSGAVNFSDEQFVNP